MYKRTIKFKCLVKNKKKENALDLAYSVLLIKKEAIGIFQIIKSDFFLPFKPGGYSNVGYTYTL